MVPFCGLGLGGLESILSAENQKDKNVESVMDTGLMRRGQA